MFDYDMVQRCVTSQIPVDGRMGLSPMFFYPGWERSHSGRAAAIPMVLVL